MDVVQTLTLSLFLFPELVRGHHHLWVPGARATQQPRPWQRTAQPRGAAAVTPGELPTFAGLRAVRARRGSCLSHVQYFVGGSVCKYG